MNQISSKLFLSSTSYFILKLSLQRRLTVFHTQTLPATTSYLNVQIPIPGQHTQHTHKPPHSFSHSLTPSSAWLVFQALGQGVGLDRCTGRGYWVLLLLLLLLYFRHSIPSKLSDLRMDGGMMDLSSWWNELCHEAYDIMVIRMWMCFLVWLLESLGPSWMSS